MKKIVEIKIAKDTYKIDLNKFHDLSIPIDADEKSPSFYDEKPLLINYYKDSDSNEW